MPTSRTLAPARCEPADDGIEIGPDVANRQTAQAVVGAQLDDDDLRLVCRERSLQAREAATSRLATRTGVDHAVSVPFGTQPGLQ